LSLCQNKLAIELPLYFCLGCETITQRAVRPLIVFHPKQII